MTLGLALRLVLANDILLDMALAKAGKGLALLGLPCEHLSFTRLSFIAAGPRRLRNTISRFEPNPKGRV